MAGSIWTWVSFRRRGVASGLRALAFTLLPVAAYLTQTLQLFTGIAGEITHWAAHLAWNPVVWIGLLVGGASVVLFVVSGMIRSRQLGKTGTPETASLPRGKAPRSAPAVDDEMAEIEALLRKRGIT